MTKIILVLLFGLWSVSSQNIIGNFDADALQKEPYVEWFGKGYQNYTPNEKIIKELRPLLKKEISINIFMGTWCPDSRKQVPHLMKILDVMEFKNFKIIGVSNDKMTPKKDIEDSVILFVPTIIIMKNGKEINRIVEYSIKSLEQDLLDISLGKNYKNPYWEE